MLELELAPPVVSNADEGFEDQVRDKILHLLKIYPKISPSMMQIGVGSSLPSKAWKPILRSLINDGLITEDIVMSKAPSGRTQTYTIIRLTSTPA